MKKLNKAALFTDYHVGAKNNSKQHNEDCINFMEWFKEQCLSDPTIDHILFLGDWFENRGAINVETLEYSYRAAKILNSIGLPVYFLVGNHDLYQRHTRDIFSTNSLQELTNIRVISEPTSCDDFTVKTLLCPFIFQSEYETLLPKYNNCPVWMGHFEFKDFVITGNSVKMMHGPDVNEFREITRILSGHYHKRQIYKNTCYIGNTFPTSFADADDSNRGMAIYQYDNNDLSFIDWPDCPTYIKCKLSQLLSDNPPAFRENARVKCIMDVDSNYESNVNLKQSSIEDNVLREFVFEESSELSLMITEDNELGIDPNEVEIAEINEFVVTTLRKLTSDKIDNNLLVEIYQEL